MEKLLKYPDPILLTPSADFDFLADKQLLKDFEKCAREGFGWGQILGLAAPQIGITKRFFLALEKLYINPEITERSKETYTAKEGCYSLERNKFDYEVKRHDWVIMKWQDRGQNWHEKKFEGFPAQVLQHEHDHILGKLCCQ